MWTEERNNKDRKQTYAESPTEKYILHVQTVIHGNIANQIIPTAIALIPNNIMKKNCWASLRMRSTVGSLVGMSGAYTGHAILVRGSEPDGITDLW
jgi:hypothetical protein